MVLAAWLGIVRGERGVWTRVLKEILQEPPIITWLRGGGWTREWGTMEEVRSSGILRLV